MWNIALKQNQQAIFESHLHNLNSVVCGAFKSSVHFFWCCLLSKLNAIPCYWWNILYSTNLIKREKKWLYRKQNSKFKMIENTHPAGLFTININMFQYIFFFPCLINWSIMFSVKLHWHRCVITVSKLIVFDRRSLLIHLSNFNCLFRLHDLQFDLECGVLIGFM